MMIGSGRWAFAPWAKCALACSLVCGVALPPRSAVADATPRPRTLPAVSASFSVTGASSCPDAAELEHLVRRYTERFKSVERDADVALALHAEPRGNAVGVTLTVSRRRAEMERRELEAATCEEAAAAMALVAAMLIDPQSATLVSATPPRAPPRSEWSRAPPWKWHVAAGLGVALMRGLGPGWGYQPRLLAISSLQSSDWAVAGRLWLGKSLLRTVAVRGASGDLEAAVNAEQAGIDSCALRRVDRLGLGPCVTMSAARLSAKAEGTALAFRRSSLWLGLGTGFQVLAPVSRSWAVELTAWGSLRVSARQRFFFGSEPGQPTAYEAPRWSTALQIFVRAQFF